MKKIGIIIFVIAVIVGVTLANFFSFGKATGSFFNFSFNFGGVKGSGNVVSEKRDIGGFSKVDVGGVYQVEIVAQKEYGIEIEADDNIVPLVRTEVRGDTLVIKGAKRFNTANRIVVRIAAPNIDLLDVSGASVVSVTNLANDKLVVDSSGASKIRVEGSTRHLNVNMSGASTLDAAGLKAELADVDASGASKIDLNVAEELRADLSGACKLSYSGNPKNVVKKTSGASSVTGR